MSTIQLKLKIITPDRTVLEEMVDSVTIPTTEGEIGIFPHHIALVSTLGSGDIVAKRGDEVIPIAVSGGFLEFNDNELAILADFAEHVHEISEDALVKAQVRAAELREMQKNMSTVDFQHYAAELERSLTRVKVADKWRGKKYRI